MARDLLKEGRYITGVWKQLLINCIDRVSARLAGLSAASLPAKKSTVSQWFIPGDDGGGELGQGIKAGYLSYSVYMSGVVDERTYVAPHDTVSSAPLERFSWTFSVPQGHSSSPRCQIAWPQSSPPSSSDRQNYLPHAGYHRPVYSGCYCWWYYMQFEPLTPRWKCRHFPGLLAFFFL